MNHRRLLVPPALAVAALVTLNGCETAPRAAPAPTASFSVPVPESFRLANGLSVWLVPSKEVPLVHVSLVLPGGSSLDPRGKEGLAALTAEMLDEGAGKRGPLEIADEVDFLGAELTVATQKEFLEVTLAALRRNLDASLDILADVVLRPAFSPGEWERVKSLALNDLAQRREEARDVARVVSERVFYGDDHPYGHPVDGYEASAKAIGLDDLKQFYAANVRPERAVLIAVGDISLDELRPRIESRFGGWKAQAAASVAAPAPAAPAAVTRLVVIDKPDAPQTEIRVLVPAPEFSSPRIAPLSLANTVLGGTFTSRLVTNLRERNGFTYGASSLVALRSRPSHVVAGSAVYGDKTGPALVELCREVHAMETGNLEPDEIAKSRSTQRIRLVESLEAQDSTADLFVLSAALGNEPGERRKYFERLEGTATEEIVAQCRDVYRWERATIVLVGDKKAIESQLAELRAKPPADLAGKPFTLPEPELRGREGEKT
jgi:zinc protease